MLFHETQLLQTKKNHVNIRNACTWILGKQAWVLIFSDFGCFLISPLYFPHPRYKFACEENQKPY